MEKQHGHHPSIGAVDTLEIYPAKNMTIEESVELAEEIGKEIFKRMVFRSISRARTHVVQTAKV